MLLWMTLLTGVAYPLAVTGIAQSIMPHQANGSLIVQDGKLIGYRPLRHRPITRRRRLGRTLGRRILSSSRT
jgi:hypothetical protein